MNYKLPTISWWWEKIKLNTNIFNALNLHSIKLWERFFKSLTVIHFYLEKLNNLLIFSETINQLVTYAMTSYDITAYSSYLYLNIYTYIIIYLLVEYFIRDRNKNIHFWFCEVKKIQNLIFCLFFFFFAFFINQFYLITYPNFERR